MFRFFRVNLSMFDGTEVPAANNMGSQPAVSAPQPTTSRSPKPTEPKVIYGKVDGETTPSAQGNSTGGESPEVDRKSAYTKIKDEYKDMFHADIEGIIKNRFKKYGNMEQEFGKYEPIVKSMMDKYGAKTTDELQQAIDQEVYQSYADERGYTLEEAKDILSTKKENALLKNREHEINIEKSLNSWYRQADEIKKTNADFDIDEWADVKPFMDSLSYGKSVSESINPYLSQIEEVKKVYPGFNLKECFKNETFIKLMNANTDIKTAYEVLDLPNILANNAKQMEQNVISNIKAKGQKQIKENGLNGSPGVIIKSDVSQFTKEDRQRIAEMVRRGEKIVL